MSAAAATSGGATASESNEETVIVTEVPDALNRALLLIVKNFFSKEAYIIVYYIMRAVCIREEHLRSKIHYDQKQLRQVLAGLKSDKLVKERLLQQKVNNRNTSIIFYFINYRAILNVLKYKIDHMRQRLEAREKEDVQKASYKCTRCSSQYETLEIDRILDPFTGLLKCWRCQGEVEIDESGGPTQVTRSLLARFNEQMYPLFATIRDLAGIQLAPHLLEPDLNKYLDDESKEQQDQAVDFSAMPSGFRELGAVAHSYANANTLKYANADQITVDMNADANRGPVEETKAIPMWLQDSSLVGESEQAAAALDLAINSGTDSVPIRHTVDMSMLAELEGMDEEPPEKKTKVDENGDGRGAGGGGGEESGSEDSDDEEEEMLEIQGEKFALSDITPDMVDRMTDVEKAAYVAAVQANMDY